MPTLSKRSAEQPPRPAPISHDAALVPDPASGTIPPYIVSEAANGKTTAELFDDVLEDRARRRAAGQLLDHESLTREFLWAESVARGRRSPADIAASSTADELARLATAEAEYAAADARRKEAHARKADSNREYLQVVRKHAGDGFGSVDSALARWRTKPSEMPPEVREFERKSRHVRDAELAEAERACSEALVRLNNVRANQAVRRQQRRADVQKEINRAGFLDNVRRLGGDMKAAVKAAADDYRPGRH